MSWLRTTEKPNPF